MRDPGKYVDLYSDAGEATQRVTPATSVWKTEEPPDPRGVLPRRQVHPDGTRCRHAQYLERRLLRRVMKRNVPGAAAARDRLITWNRKAERPRMQPGAREMLMKHYNDDLEQFHQLLGVDMIDQELAAAMPKRPPIGELNNR